MVDDTQVSPVAWLAYPLRAVWSRLAEAVPPAEISCELVDGSRVEAVTEDNLRVVRVIRIKGQEGTAVRYQLVVDRSPQIRPEQVRSLPGGTRFGKDANQA
jgi:hypothetical protein